MNDIRTKFDEALDEFRKFLKSQGWSNEILWLSSDRITGHRCTFWVYRPENLTSSAISRRFYEKILKTSSSIRIDALAVLDQKTLAYVEDWGGVGRFLNFGIRESPKQIKVVNSNLYWWLIKTLNYIRGETPLLKDIIMTGNK